MLTVTVNDRPVNVAAIVERGRVLLPIRATFGALGASVGYDPAGRVIVARSATHALRLAIGSHEAIVDGRRLRLDVPARVIADRTFVPLRFVAQAMGAVVGYDARADLVSVVSRNAASGRGVASTISIVALTPAPQSIVATAYPTISASLGTAGASRAQVSLMLDGQDVTALASFDGSTITYMPRSGMSRGRHTVQFSGTTLSGQRFSQSWSFDTSLQAPPDAPSFDKYNFNFYTSGPGTYYAGDWMHFVLVAPPGGSAEMQLCDLGYSYALYSTAYGTLYEANFPAPAGYWMPSCAATAVYTAWNGRRYYVPIPVVVGLYTGNRPHPRRTPQPKPSFTPPPIPTGPRHPEPTAAPTAPPTPRSLPPAPRPLPTHLPLPRPREPRRPVRRPIPHPLPRPTP